MSEPVGRRVLLGRVVMTVLVLALLAGGGVLGYRNYVEEFLQDYCRGYLRAVEKGDLDKAYREVGDAWRTAQPQEAFEAFHRRLTDALGPLRGVTFIRATLDDSERANLRAEVVFAAQFERGEATLTLALHREAVTVEKESYGEEVVIDAEDWFLKHAVFESKHLPGASGRLVAGALDSARP
jgi:hypothetical protein